MLFRSGISVSFGCVNSLISMPCRMSHASIDAKTRKERQMPEDVIRLCVGIEDVDDLIDDLTRAVSLYYIASPEKNMLMDEIDGSSWSTKRHSRRLPRQEHRRAGR